MSDALANGVGAAVPIGGLLRPDGELTPELLVVSELIPQVMASILYSLRSSLSYTDTIPSAGPFFLGFALEYLGELSSSRQWWEMSLN